MYRNRAKFVVYVVFIIIFSSCENKTINSTKFIENLSNDIDFDLPLVNESLMIFICKNENIYVTSLRKLHFINKNKYKNINEFDIFLCSVLNNDLLSEADLKVNSVNTFCLNKNIVNEFSGNGIKYIIATYCEKSNIKGKFYLKNKLNLNIKQSVMYFLFKNNYYIYQNDYLGKYVMIDKN